MWTEINGTYTLEFTPKITAVEAPELPYPYLSQWDTPDMRIEYDGAIYIPNSNRTRGDCGPAALAMMLWKRTNQRPTVNQVGIACGQPVDGNGSMYTNHGQLRAGAASYGVTLQTRSPYILPRLDLDLLREELAAGRPVIALILYKALREELQAYPDSIKNQDDFNGAHWVLVVEMSEDAVWIMDPDFWGDRREEGNYRRVPILAFDEALRRTHEASGCSVGYQGLVLVP
jgi:hypothetical protein